MQFIKPEEAINYSCFVFFLPFQSFQLFSITCSRCIGSCISGQYVRVCVIAHRYTEPVENSGESFAFKLDFKFSNSYILFFDLGQKFRSQLLINKIIRWGICHACFRPEYILKLKKKNISLNLDFATIQSYLLRPINKISGPCHSHLTK